MSHLKFRGAYDYLIIYLETGFIFLTLWFGFVLAIFLLSNIFLFLFQPIELIVFIIIVLIYFFGYVLRNKVHNRQYPVDDRGEQSVFMTEILYFCSAVLFVFFLGFSLIPFDSPIPRAISDHILAGLKMNDSIAISLGNLAEFVSMILTFVGVIMLIIYLPLIVYLKSHNKVIKAIGLIFLIIIILAIFYIGSEDLGDYVINKYSNKVLAFRDVLLGPAVIYYFYVTLHGSKGLERLALSSKRQKY